MSVKNTVFIRLLLVLSLIGGCSPKSEPPTTALPEQDVPQISQDLRASEAHFWTLNAEAVSTIQSSAQNLESTVNHLLQETSAESLTAAQKAWQDLAINYHQLRLLESLDNSQPAFLELGFNLEARLAAQPIQPGYLDYFGPYQYSGLVHDIGVRLNAETLLHQHQATDTEEVVLGLYAIEFMLFGEKGNRPPEDYVIQDALSQEQIEQGLQSTNEVAANRRRKLLRIQVSQFIDDLNALVIKVVDRPDSSARNYLSLMQPVEQLNFIKAGSDQVLTQILVELANLQTLVDLQSEGIPEVDQSAGTLANKIRQQLSSVAAASLYYSAIETSSIESTIRDANSTLVSLDTDDAEAVKPLLQDLYQKIKLLL